MTTAVSGPSVLAYPEDPGAPDHENPTITRPVPRLGDPPLPTAIDGPQPDPGEYDPTTRDFLYWDAADALRRASDLWGAVAGSDVQWHPSVGRTLVAKLDQGVDLNAFYDREGLSFFHDTVRGHKVFSAASPDIVAHEHGHAVLDALRPQLFDAHSAEPPAFHEAFGDMSAILAALRLPDVREQVIRATDGHIDRSSPLSRLAEQLGWAIRQNHPDAVDPDCLRNASNSFFYADPITLPPQAPASQLSSESHSFSRVFSGAFLSCLAGMFAQQDRHYADVLEAVALDLGGLLVEAVRTSPITVSYYSQIAAHMLAADDGTYADALRTGFVRHGVLSLEDATGDLRPATPRTRAMVASSDGDGAAGLAPLPRIALPGAPFGLRADLIVQAAAEPKRYSVAGAAPDMSRVRGTADDRASMSFVEDLFRRGHVVVPDDARSGREVVRARRHATHEIRAEEDLLVLRRRHFYCGLRGEE